VLQKNYHIAHLCKAGGTWAKVMKIPVIFANIVYDWACTVQEVVAIVMIIRLGFAMGQWPSGFADGLGILYVQHSWDISTI
jgi:hypothetical protein